MKRIYTWGEFDKDIRVMVERLKKQEFDEIYGVPRGGLVMGVLLSHRLNLPLSLEFHKDKRVLVVDDICDSGKTISEFGGGNTTVATLFVNTEHNNDIWPDFWVRTTKDWIIFPWETIESSKYDYNE